MRNARITIYFGISSLSRHKYQHRSKGFVKHERRSGSTFLTSFDKDLFANSVCPYEKTQNGSFCQELCIVCDFMVDKQENASLSYHILLRRFLFLVHYGIFRMRSKLGILYYVHDNFIFHKRPPSGLPKSGPCMISG